MRGIGVGLVLVVWNGDTVDDEEDAEDCCVDKVAHALHGESQHHLHINLCSRECMTSNSITMAFADSHDPDINSNLSRSWSSQSSRSIAA